MKTTPLLIFFLITCLLFGNNWEFKDEFSSVKTTQYGIVNSINEVDTLFKNNPQYIALNFDFAVGRPNGKGYYNAQKFTENGHLGDDWNGLGGGNSDMGDPIYAIGDGYVNFAEDISGGWGKVIRIIHKFKNNYYESLYAHCDTILAESGCFIKKGSEIATIGNANGQYYAHLHLEIRDSLFMGTGGGYSEDTSGYIDPTAFLKKN